MRPHWRGTQATSELVSASSRTTNNGGQLLDVHNSQIPLWLPKKDCKLAAKGCNDVLSVKYLLAA